MIIIKMYSFIYSQYFSRRLNMSAVFQTNKGTVTVTDDFIASVAGFTATECYGVVGMSSKKVMDSVNDILKKENVKKGVKVYTEQTNTVKIDLFIVVEYGTSISAIASSIIQTVKYNVEKITGLNVLAVNVIVSGIRVG